MKKMKNNKYLLLIALVSSASQANIFNTQHIKGYTEPSLSIIGDFAINQDASSYEVFFDSDNDGDDDRLTVSTNAQSSVLNVTLSINDGNGVFTDSSQNFNSINSNKQVNVKLMDIYLKDLDNDGFIDLWFHTKTAIADYNFSIDNSFIFSNKHENEYELANSFYTESYENSHTSKGRTLMIFEDVDGDGLIDPRFHNLYVHDFPAAQYQLVNDGGFQFSVKAESTLAYTKKVVAMNYNNDGYQDVISLSYIYFPSSLGLSSPNLMNTKQSALWLADGSGGFYAQENELPLNTAQNIWVFDVNGDAKDDILISYRDANNFDTSELYFSDQSSQYSNHITLDDVVFDAKVADMDNDGRIDLVVSSGTVSIYKNLDLSTFTKVAELGAKYDYTRNLLLDDMDNDGKIDVLGIESFGNMFYIRVANNQGQMDFADFDTVKYSYSRRFVATDVDLDGVPEIMVSPYSARFQDPSYILKRNNIGDYHWITSDFDDVKDGMDSFFTYSNFIAEDMDNDGRDDIVAIDVDYSTPKRYMLKVVMHEQSSAIEYYNNADVFLSKDKNYFIKRQPTFDVADFNNDGLKDIVFSGDGGLSIMTQTPNPKVETMYYDPNHNGHGYSLENIGRDNLYYNAFFTYDNNGEPEWFLQLNKMKSTEDGVQIYPINPDVLKNDISYLYDFASASAFIDNRIERHGFIQNDSLGEDFFLFNFALNNENPAELFQWNTQRLITHEQEPVNDFGGMWWAGVDDAGWGISLMSVQRVDRVDLIAVLFFYDGDGNPRWLIGDAEGFIPSQPITLSMDMIQGYGRGQTPLELVRIPAGHITLSLNEASQDITRSGTMSMNVRYPQGAQVDWIRNNIPFTMLSKPKN